MVSQLVDFSSGAPIEVNVKVEWMDGSKLSEPRVQVHALDEHTFVLRQSLKTNFEGPFVFLLLGNTGAILIDSGATEDAEIWPVRVTVDQIVANWLAKHPNPSYQLTVAHSHGHDDHKAGDSQFAGRPNTTIVPTHLEGVQEQFGFVNWPEEVVPFDLGGRIISVIAGPGHEAAAVIYYDPWTGVLFTGDTLYPGRLYVEDMPAFIASLGRTIAFMSGVKVTHLLGCHIEMSSTPGQDYPLGSRSHPGEVPLPMHSNQLAQLLARAVDIAATPGIYPYDDVIIYNGAAVVDAYLRPTIASPTI